jgi:hypothetical protein
MTSGVFKAKGLFRIKIFFSLYTMVHRNIIIFYYAIRCLVEFIKTKLLKPWYSRYHSISRVLKTPLKVFMA